MKARVSKVETYKLKRKKWKNNSIIIRQFVRCFALCSRSSWLIPASSIAVLFKFPDDPDNKSLDHLRNALNTPEMQNQLTRESSVMEVVYADPTDIPRSAGEQLVSGPSFPNVTAVIPYSVQLASDSRFMDEIDRVHRPPALEFNELHVQDILDQQAEVAARGGGDSHYNYQMNNVGCILIPSFNLASSIFLLTYCDSLQLPTTLTTIIFLKHLRQAGGQNQLNFKEPLLQNSRREWEAADRNAADHRTYRRARV